MAYVYRHIRLDTNQPFYIGIGSDDKYNRAYQKRSRNQYWKSIVSNTNYKVEIIFENLNWEDACKKEIEFISLYGRKDLHKGILCNQTNGGDGVVGHSKEVLKKISEANKGRISWNKGKSNIYSEEKLKHLSEVHKNISEETRNKMRIANSIISDEKRKKMSDAQKGNRNASKPRSMEVRIRQSQRMKGKKRIISFEKLKELSERMKGNKYRVGLKLSEEQKLKISKANKGKIFTQEHRYKLSISKIKNKPNKPKTL
jgi:hypothetical protein